MAQAVTLVDVQDYLNNMTTFEASFEQVSPGQDYARGHFYMQRPRQFLWKYEEPEMQKLISTGSRLYFHDSKTEQTTQLPLNMGLAALFVKDKIDLSEGDLWVKNTTQGDGWFSAELAMQDEADGYMEGSISLVFKTEPLQLKKIVTADAFGAEIHVLFDHIKEGHVIAANTFDFTPAVEDF